MLERMAPMHTPEDDAQLFQQLADAAAAAILPHFRALEGVESKSSARFDPVTIADRAAEAAIREILRHERPEDGVSGEEFADHAGRSGRTWILDPIDGTRGFMMGLPTWGVLIALADEGGVRQGLMGQPFVGERFFTEAGGAWHVRGDRRTALRTRGCAALGEAICATTSPDLFDNDHRRRFDRLREAVRMVRYGTDCYAYALLAAGHVDLVVERGLKPYDIAPFIPLIEAAGGAIVDWSGHPIGHTLPGNYNGEAIAVGDRVLLDPVLKTLAG